MKKLFILFFLFVFSGSFAQPIAGIINSYAAVTSINTNTLGLTTVAGFAVGDKVMVIQMQGASITTANNATYGNITGYGSAGKYEFNYVGAINATSVTLTCPLINTYNTTGAVQLIRVPVYTNATITNTLTAQAWNGTTGGVLVLESATLTFNSDINVDGLGFRGGAFASGGFCCSSNNFVTTSVAGGQKGESIAKYTPGADGSKGKNASGGGGTNCGNSGGGGGANGGAGGIGGNQYSGCGAAGGDQGVGGINHTYSGSTLVFMGAGGGGGFRDNGQSCTPGAAGGAIVFIISGQLACNNRTISAKGNDVTVNSVDEGSGGGGGGGSVFISCPAHVGNITINTQGGKGGSNLNTTFPNDCHGPGGGGGGGVYAFSPAVIPGGVTHVNLGGAAGLVLNPASTCFNTSWGGASGSSGITIPNLTLAVTVTTITVSGPTTACLGSAITLTASGTSSYTWNTGPQTATVSVNPPALTVYTVVGGAGSCTASATHTVNPIPSPTLSVAGTLTVCPNQATILTASGASSYTWSTGPTTNTVSVAPAASTVYTVMGSSATCSSQTTATVAIFPSPTPTISSNTPICAGQTINLNGSAGTGHAWSGPAGFASFLQSPVIPLTSTANTGIYTLSVTAPNGCVTTATHAVVVNPLPNILTTNTTVCVGQNIVLIANGGTSYSWTGPNSFSSGMQNPVLINANSSMAGQYTVGVTNANTCSNTAIANVGVNPIPTPTVGSNSPVCINQLLSMSAGGGVSYSWNGPNGFFSSAQSPTFVPFTSAQSGNYIVTVSDAIGCSTSTNINITINNLPNPIITSPNSNGCSPMCATFTVSNATPISFATWNYGDGSGGAGLTSSHCYNTSGNFSITTIVVDANSCIGTGSFNIVAYPKPIADFNYAPYFPVANESNIQFTDASHGTPIKSWSWYFVNTEEHLAIDQNPLFTYTEAGNYEAVLVVKSSYGCYDTIIKTIVVYEDFGIYVPNTFTPNGDLINELFQPKGFGITKFEMQIFDRWGEKVFETTDFNEGWDGKYHSKNDVAYKILPTGVYVYKIKLVNVSGQGKDLTGHVTLLR
jgi:gliding motility-associated-like protein